MQRFVHFITAIPHKQMYPHVPQQYGCIPRTRRFWNDLKTILVVIFPHNAFENVFPKLTLRILVSIGQWMAFPKH